jgi:hypothetical protein
MATASLAHQPQTLYHTNFDAFARALRAVAPEVQRTAAEYRTKFQAEGVRLNEQEALGYAVTLLLRLAGPADEDEYYDRMAAEHDPAAAADYNDDELLACGIDRY